MAKPSFEVSLLGNRMMESRGSGKVTIYEHRPGVRKEIRVKCASPLVSSVFIRHGRRSVFQASPSRNIKESDDYK